MRDKPKQTPLFFFSGSPASEEHWRPSVDVYRTRSGWLLKFDLAGVRPEDVRVEVQGCRITVSGVRRDWVVEDVYSHHSMEISYNEFRRTIELPCHLLNPRISMESRNGILMMRVTSGEGDA